MKTVAMRVMFGISMIFMACRGLPIRGNGDLVSSEMTVSSFEKVRSGGSAVVRFHASQEYRVVVTADSNLIDFVKVNVDGNTLRIQTKSGNYSFTKFLVDVYCPVLTGVSLSGSGSFSSDDKIITSSFQSVVSGSGTISGTFECENYVVDISGSGKIDANIKCNSFSVVISGSGDIAVIGASDNLNIRISGSGSFNGREFKTNNVTARISGSGDMSIWAVESIDATVSGSGSIKYRGSPKINFNGSGSGRIRSE